MNWLDEGALYSSIGLFLREDLGRLLFPPADAELIRRLISRSA